MALPDKFCKAPFAGAMIATTGELATCCEYMTHESDLPQYHVKDFDHWWTHGLLPLRTRMITDQEDAGCRHCRSKESNAKESHLRAYTNWQVKSSADWLAQQAHGGQKLATDLLEIRLGNLCNLGCIMCHSSLSSTIAAEVSQNQEQFASIGIHAIAMPSPWWKDPVSWRRALDLASQAKWVHVSGGEPFMHPYIDELLLAVSPQCNLSINTNLTLIDDARAELLSQLPRLKLTWSVEGIGQHNAYVRWPTVWQDIERTLARLKSIKIEAYHVLQHTSVFALPALIDWIEQQGLPITFGRVYDKSIDGSGMMTIDSVSDQDHDRFSSWLSDYHGPYREVLITWAQQRQFNADLHARFRRYVTVLDSIRGTDFDRVFAPNWAV